MEGGETGLRKQEQQQRGERKEWGERGIGREEEKERERAGYSWIPQILICALKPRVKKSNDNCFLAFICGRRWGWGVSNSGCQQALCSLKNLTGLNEI